MNFVRVYLANTSRIGRWSGRSYPWRFLTSLDRLCSASGSVPPGLEKGSRHLVRGEKDSDHIYKRMGIIFDRFIFHAGLFYSFIIWNKFCGVRRRDRYKEWNRTLRVVWRGTKRIVTWELKIVVTVDSEFENFKDVSFQNYRFDNGVVLAFLDEGE